MKNKNENNSSLIPIGSTGLVRVSNSISVTNKLLAESKFQFSGDFKGEQIWKVDGHKMAVRQIIIADNILNNKSCLVSAGEDGFISLYDLSNGDCFFKEQIENNWLTSIAVWNEKLLCAGRSGKLFRVTFDEDCISREVVQAHELIIKNIVVSPNNRSIATCSWDDTIKIWEPKKLKETKKILAHNFGVNDVLFLPNNETVISCGKDEKIKIWDIKSKAQLGQFDGHKHWVEAITFNSSKNILASGSCDNTIKIWDIDKQDCLLTIENEEWINDLVFSDDGNYLVANCYNGISKVFDTKSFQLICEYNEHSKVFPYHHSIKREATNWIYSVLFDKTNKAIYTASVDGSIHKWK
ncbi:WD40 repeat domain-containing protein [Marinifilum sp. RC60d5]|uniref:WD40 repeat domain-containing protein n=1 Tax=Marinifilum sp. RC60d5 TaxID=3458414 RepID=UPI0040354791